jgi:hypothetical protein
MKIAFFWDNCTVDSFYVKNGTAYRWKDHQPYTYDRNLNAQCMLDDFNYLYTGNEGYFFNLTHEEDLPDIELDILFYACERNGLDTTEWNKYNVEKIREKYKIPIIGTVKELGRNFPEVHRPGRFQDRIKFFNKCDYAHMFDTGAIRDTNEFKDVSSRINKPFNFSNQCMNVDYLFENFYSDEKEFKIFVYRPVSPHRFGRTFEFANYLSQKYNIELVMKDASHTRREHLSSLEFIKLWSQCAFLINMDPLETQPGWQAIQTACTGTINIGGLNDSHKNLYPTLATNDEQILEQEFKKMITDDKYRFDIISSAWQKVNELHSFKTCKEQISELYLGNM